MFDFDYLQSGESKTYKADDIIYKSGGGDNKIYFIKSGEILSKKKLSDDTIYKTIHYQGEFLGIQEAVTFQPRITDATVLKDAELYVWTPENFYIDVCSHPETSRISIANLSELLRNINQHKEKLTTQHLDERLINVAIKRISDRQMRKILSKIAFSTSTYSLIDEFEKFGVKYESGNLIFDQGSLTDDLYIILDGNVDIIVYNDAGELINVATLKESEFLGEMSHFDGKPRSATAVAKGDVKLLKFTKDSFNIIFQLEPKWTIKLIQTLSTRIVKTFQLIFQTKK